MSPFEVVYGFKPLTPLDLHPIEQVDQMVSQDGLAKAELMKKLHAEAKANIEKRTEAFERAANKHRKEMIFQPGDWVWLHMRPERFPDKRSAKLAPRGDGPFRVLERINNNAYRLELPEEVNISHTFNVTDLSPFIAGTEPVLRSEHPEEGGNDEAIQPGNLLPRQEPPVTRSRIDHDRVPAIQTGPMTRNKDKQLRLLFGQATQEILDDLMLEPAQVDNDNIPWPLLKTSSFEEVFTITLG